MTTTNVKASENVLRLQKAIGLTIVNHTMVSPMSEEDVIAVLGFCAGAAIANANQRNTIRQYREMLIANVDLGINAFLSQPNSGLILPN